MREGEQAAFSYYEVSNMERRCVLVTETVTAMVFCHALWVNGMSHMNPFLPLLVFTCQSVRQT